ncbi:hypothetical protein RB614_10745 [Phytohabitans sp. ZYX-F-186]|uniref:Uncharacterized protein n=1 Tax=Phytohabitans maris TaxID=3071409 RepID=A0ABU0ZD64_9ACTN|nr:hypothetical protein [Phytohabitans sp. ZYX-F-186]MDQ7904999.1 hypothetical protein [Phytohabitans sp. ZYX-F-186]
MLSPARLARRRAGLACLVAAPILLTAATAVDPALGDVEFAAAIAADPGAARLHTLLLHWSWVLFVPGLLALLAPIRRRGRVLATIAWPAAVLGLATFAGLTLSDYFGLAVLEVTDVATFERVEDQVGGYGWLAAGWQVPGLLGWALAPLLTPLAAARAGHTGWWYPAVALPGFVLYLLFAITEPPLSLAGPVLLTVANAVLAARLWARPPAGTAEDGPAPFRRTLGVVCLIGAPLALAAGMATLPGGAFHIAADFAADPAAAQASAFFLHLAWLLFVPAVVEVTGRLTGRGWRLAQVAGAVALLGLLHFNGLMIGDYAALAAEQVLDPARVDAVTARVEGDASLSLGVAVPGMLGALLGLVLVPVAAARAGLVRWPVPVLAGAGVVAFFALTVGRVPGLVAPLLLLAAYGLLARAVAAPAAKPEPVPLPATS